MRLGYYLGGRLEQGWVWKHSEVGIQSLQFLILKDALTKYLSDFLGQGILLAAWLPSLDKSGKFLLGSFQFCLDCSVLHVHTKPKVEVLKDSEVLGTQF